MRNRFPGHFKPSEFVLKTLWDGCQFVLDTSVLLNSYSYSEKTRSEFMGLLERLQDRLWLPFQVGSEFLTRRLGIISRNIKKYEGINQKLNEILASIDSPDEHPFMSGDSLETFRKAVRVFLEHVDRVAAPILALSDNDEILESYAKLFEGKVGMDYDEARLTKVFQEGKSRYIQKIPPGYLDNFKGKRGQSKDEEPSDEGEDKENDRDKGKEKSFFESKKNNTYGDLVVWFQILDYAQTAKSSVILVTDERSADWWRIHDNKIIGPRPELITEFREKASEKNFYLYTAAEFMSAAEKYLEKRVEQSAIDEARIVQERETAVAELERKRERNWAEIGNLARIGERVTAFSKIAEFNKMALDSAAFKSHLLDPGIFAKLNKNILNSAAFKSHPIDPGILAKLNKNVRDSAVFNQQLFNPGVLAKLRRELYPEIGPKPAPQPPKTVEAESAGELSERPPQPE